MAFLHSIADSFHLRFKKGHLVQVLFQLVVNFFYSLKLKAIHCISGSKKPIVHLYAPCWNEEKMLLFMFNHYQGLVSHFFIYDNGSTDGSRQIVSSRKDATLLEYHSNGIDDKALIEFKNSCWKKSRGKADFVIVCDVDEFLDFPDFDRLLAESKFSVFRPNGFNMVCESFPEAGTNLAVTLRDGVADNEHFSKCILFNPYKIVDIAFSPGAHKCSPTGIVNFFEDGNLKLLHYKYLGLEYLRQRNYAYRERLSDFNKTNGYGLQYLDMDNALKETFEALLHSARKIV